MKEKKPMGAHYALGVTKLCFYGGFVLLMLALAAGSVDMVWILYVLGVLGFIGMFGGLIFGFCKVRCPYCGKSLMLGGRLPRNLPDYCPGCGNMLDETD